MIPPARRLLVALLTLLPFAHAAPADEPPRPIRALLVCGGCCHDYTKQKVLIAEGLAERAFIEVTAVQQGGTATNSKIPLYDNADWAKGYDIVLHDECFSDVKDLDYVKRILKPHSEGLPGVVIHCAMHSYRTGADDWFDFCGVTSRRHGAAYAHEVMNVDADHPIMKGFGPAWANPAGELYWIEKVGPRTHPLATSKNQEKGNDEVCVWTNTFGRGRVFGTTLGHHNETVGATEYLDLLARGVLWACDKLEPKYLKPKKPKLVSVNLARGAKATASSEEAGKGNVAARALDGNPATRWCANGPQAPQWLRIDLEKPTKLTALRLDWESAGGVYRYKVEASIDDKNWHTLVDGSNNEKPSPNEHQLKPEHWQSIRVTFLGNPSGGWGSLREVELYGDAKVEASAAPGAADAEEARRLSDVGVPPGYEARVFAAPPAANYPVFVAAAPDGTLYVSSDKNGSLDRAPRRGSVVRLRDIDGDGRADEAKRFVPDVDSPRGLVWDRDRLYLMHPPHLSTYIDKDGDGVADEEKVLVRNIAFTFKDRPADHTSNGVTLGVDGWLYLAIGDFGFLKAEGADGRTLQLRGGGVMRVRPDGTGLELYARGTRNILEVGLDPLLNGFARDNTNDGGGWDIRLHHFSGLEEHGYPSLFRNFADEIVAPLADYGGGSGCGALFLDEPGFPQGDSPALYTADWGRERVFRHHLRPSGATFAADQSEFVRLPRVTDLDVDALGHLYLSSWKGATFTYAGEDVGYIVRVTPKGMKAEPLPEWDTLDSKGLVTLLASPSHRRRLEAQRTLLRRGVGNSAAAALQGFASDRSKPSPGRVAALFALKQGQGAGSTPFLVELLDDATVREYALRALTDRAGELAGVPSAPIVAGLKDESPRVRRQAAESLARLGRAEEAPALTPLLADADPVVAHTAVQAMIRLDAADAAFAVVDRSDASAAARAGALRVLQALHKTPVVDGLIARLDREADPARRLGLFVALARLSYRDGEWKGNSWGTRPDTSGPYYQPERWEESGRIEAALRAAIGRAGPAELAGLMPQLDRHKVKLADSLGALIAAAGKDASLRPAVVAEVVRADSVPAAALPVLIAAARDDASPAGLRAQAVATLARADDTNAYRAILHVLPKLRGDDRALESSRRAFLGAPKLANQHALFESVAAAKDGPASAWADAALLVLSTASNGSPEVRAFATAALDRGWADPARRAQILHAVALADFEPYADKVRVARGDADPAVSSAAREAARALDLDAESADDAPKLSNLPVADAIAAVADTHGRSRQGERLFLRLGCVNCHTVRGDEPPKGPYLGTIAKTYKRRELAEAVLMPSKSIAQGFVTNVFGLEDGRTVTGFVVREAADAVTIRDADGKETILPASQIEERARSNVSVMPEGLVKGLTAREFASLLDYLESLSR